MSRKDDRNEFEGTEVFELTTALSLARTVLLEDLYLISLFIGPCKEERKTKWAIQQIDRIMRHDELYKS